MTWDGKKRRATDNMENFETTLARIDENVQFLKSGAEITRVQLHEHEQKDEVKFKDIGNKIDSINRTVWSASGIFAAVIFFIKIFTKH